MSGRILISPNRIVRFNSSGTWTVPPGVFFAYVKMKGGGPGATDTSTGIPGSASSVAFSSGTLTAPGGQGGHLGGTVTGIDGPANTGDGPAWRVATTYSSGSSDKSSGAGTQGGNGGVVAMGRWQGHEVSGGAPVTPGSSITVTIGAGGDGTIDGGSGYVDIEYEV